jgi:hypothetical protein
VSLLGVPRTDNRGWSYDQPHPRVAIPVTTKSTPGSSKQIHRSSTATSTRATHQPRASTPRASTSTNNLPHLTSTYLGRYTHQSRIFRVRCITRYLSTLSRGLESLQDRLLPFTTLKGHFPLSSISDLKDLALLTQQHIFSWLKEVPLILGHLHIFRNGERHKLPADDTISDTLSLLPALCKDLWVYKYCRVLVYIISSKDSCP